MSVCNAYRDRVRFRFAGRWDRFQRGQAGFVMLLCADAMSLPSTSLNRKDLFLRACRGERVPRLPVWMMRQAGRYLPEYREIRAKRPFLEVCKTPDLAVEVSLQPYRRLGVDAVIVFSDILIPPEAMGRSLDPAAAAPHLPHPTRAPTDVDRLRIFDPEIDTHFLNDAIRQIVQQVGP